MPSHLKGPLCNIYRDLLAYNWIENTCVHTKSQKWITVVFICLWKRLCSHKEWLYLNGGATTETLHFQFTFSEPSAFFAVFGTSEMKQTSEATKGTTRTTFWPPKSVSAAATHAFHQSNIIEPHNLASHTGSCYANQGRLRPPQTTARPCRVLSQRRQP